MPNGSHGGSARSYNYYSDDFDDDGVGNDGDDVDNDHLCPAIVGLGQRRCGQGQ